MVSHRRSLVPGGTCFFTLALKDETSRALVDHIDALRDAFSHTRQHSPFSMPAVVILPDHLHAIWQLPQGDDGFSARWTAITSRFTQALIRSGAIADRCDARDVWQEFVTEGEIRDDADWKDRTDRIHLDPVKHGLATTASAWPYSSFHNHVRNSLLPRNWAGAPDVPA